MIREPRSVYFSGNDFSVPKHKHIINNIHMVYTELQKLNSKPNNFEGLNKFTEAIEEHSVLLKGLLDSIPASQSGSSIKTHSEILMETQRKMLEETTRMSECTHRLLQKTLNVSDIQQQQIESLFSASQENILRLTSLLASEGTDGSSLIKQLLTLTYSLDMLVRQTQTDRDRFLEALEKQREDNRGFNEEILKKMSKKCCCIL